MCNRYRMTANQRELAARYGVEAPYPEDETYPAPELFPKSLAWTVRGCGAAGARPDGVGLPVPAGGGGGEAGHQCPQPPERLLADGAHRA